MKDIKINIQETSNETIIKFASNSILINGGSYEYSNIDEAKNSPLAQQLFHLPFVKKLFITANFIAIQRYDIVQWSDVEEEVKEQIQAYLEAGYMVVNEDIKTKKETIEVYAEATPNPSVMKFGTNKALTQTDVEYKNIDEASSSSPLAKALNVEVSKENLDETSVKIVDILDEYIKPAVASDGGNIAFKSYDPETKLVRVILQGACSGCPSSTATLKNGIETMLKEMLPNQINEVVAING